MNGVNETKPEERESEQIQIVDPTGRLARRQEAGQPCLVPSCGAAGSYVRPVMGGECVCMKCGYQE